MAPFAIEPNSQACWSRNRRHHTHRNVARLQDRTLFDVQFKKRLIVAFREDDIIQRSGKTGSGSHLLQRLSFLVGQSFGSSGLQASRKQAAAQTSDTKTCRLLRREHQKLDRAPWLKTGALQCANSFQTTKNTDGAIVRAGKGNRIGM